MDKKTEIEVEAAAFRTLRKHLMTRSDVQNIDMMNLTGFCRNCLSRWYQEAAEDQGVTIDKMTARETFYGMPFEDWKVKHQSDATPKQKENFEKSHNSR